MESKAKILGHPIHQVLIPFPFGLLGTAVIFDIVYLVWGNSTMVTVSYWMIIAGVIGGLVAAPFGVIDFLAIPAGTRAKSVGLVHGLLRSKRQHAALCSNHRCAGTVVCRVRARRTYRLAGRRAG